MTPLLRKLLLIDLFKYHKTKLFMFVVFFVMIFVWIFPFSDLSDFVTDQVASQTQGQVFVQFGNLDFGILPTFSIQGEDVLIDSSQFPTLHVDEVRFWPSLMSLLSSAQDPTQIPNFSVRTKGLFKGDLSASVSSGKGSNKDIPMKLIQVEGKKLDLAEISPIASLPLKLQGRASLEGIINIDPQFQVQPEGDIALTGEKVRIPPGNVPTQMGPLFLPGFSWSSINAKSRLSNGVIYVEQATLGQPGDALYLRLKGQLGAPIQPRGFMVRNFDLKMDLQINPQLAKELGPFLSFIDRFKRSSGANSRYVFRAVSNSPGSPPDLLPLSNF